jgi:hypothetical protein
MSFTGWTFIKRIIATAGSREHMNVMQRVIAVFNLHILIYLNNQGMRNIVATVLIDLNRR